MIDGAAIIVIGNEILTGKVRDATSPYLLRELRALGFPVHRVVVIPDDVDVIAREVRRHSEEFSQVFTSGGVGPTLDDVTFDGICKAFGLELVEDERMARVIREHFGERTTPSHLKMALVPTGARLDFDGRMPWPVVEVENVMVLPGDPGILRKKFESVKERFRRAPWHARRIYTLLEEGDLAPILERLEGGHPEVAIGSYPVYEKSDYKVLVTIESKDAADVERAFEDLRRMIPEREIVRAE